MEKRDNSLDAVHGLMLSHMIILHTCGLSGVNQNQLSIVICNLLFCFMPWFYFKSGSFFKPIELRYMLYKDIKRLLCPFVVFSFFGFVVYEIITPGDQFWYMVYSLLNRGAVPGNEPLWFLLSLFFSKFFFHFLYKKKWLLIIPLLAYLGLSIQYFSLPWYVLNVLSGTFFYGLGYWLKSIQYSKLSLVVSGVFFCFLLFYSDSQVAMYNNQLLKGYRALWILESVCAIIFYNNLFRLFANSYWLKPLIYMGCNAMGFYCLHWIILEIVLYFLVGVSPLYLFSTCILLYTTIPVFNFLFRKVNLI